MRVAARRRAGGARRARPESVPPTAIASRQRGRVTGERSQCADVDRACGGRRNERRARSRAARSGARARSQRHQSDRPVGRFHPPAALRDPNGIGALFLGLGVPLCRGRARSGRQRPVGQLRRSLGRPRSHQRVGQGRHQWPRRSPHRCPIDRSRYAALLSLGLPSSDTTTRVHPNSC